MKCVFATVATQYSIPQLGFSFSQDLKETGLEISPAAPRPRSSTGTIEGRPWAHWKGKAQDARRETRAAHSPLERGSLNIIAPRIVSFVRFVV